MKFFTVAAYFIFLLTVYKGSTFSTSSPCYLFHFDNNYSNGYEVIVNSFIFFYTNLLWLITLSLIRNKSFQKTKLFSIQLLIYMTFRNLNLNPPNNIISTDISLIKMMKGLKSKLGLENLGNSMSLKKMVYLYLLTLVQRGDLSYLNTIRIF